MHGCVVSGGDDEEEADDFDVDDLSCLVRICQPLPKSTGQLHLAIHPLHSFPTKHLQLKSQTWKQGDGPRTLLPASPQRPDLSRKFLRGFLHGEVAAYHTSSLSLSLSVSLSLALW